MPQNLERIPWSQDFIVDHARRVVLLLDSSQGSSTSKACNASIQAVVDKIIGDTSFRTVHGQHSEPFAVLGAKFPVQIERFCAPLFGIINRGAHLTIYTREAESMKIWVPRRSASVFTYPNMLDTTVAGGVPASESPLENVVREADEEASLPANMVMPNIKACGALTYIQESAGRTENEPGVIAPDIVYVFDLEVDRAIIPRPKDDEVKEFYLLTVEEVRRALTRAEFKTNSAVVMIDFLIRHGFITSDNEKDYVEIISRMHRRLPFPTTPA